MRHIRTHHVAKDNAQGRHYTPKSPVAAMQVLDPIHPAPSKNLTTRPQLLKLGYLGGSEVGFCIPMSARLWAQPDARQGDRLRWWTSAQIVTALQKGRRPRRPLRRR
jgi:hypothetical protein